MSLSAGGGGVMRISHSNRKSTTHKSGEISQKCTHDSGEFMKIIPIDPGMPKQLTNRWFLTENCTRKFGRCKKLLKTLPINPDSIMKKVPKKMAQLRTIDKLSYPTPLGV